MNQQKRDLVFLSYAHEDLDKIYQIYEGLLKRKLDVWFDKEHLRPGRFKPQIKKAITRSRYFVICISEAALRKTGDEPGFQDEEFNTAYNIAEAQVDKEFTIIPVRLEDCVRGDFRLTSFQQYDLFDDFEKGMDRLAVDLGGLSLSDATDKDERTEEEKLISGLMVKAGAAYYASDYEKTVSIINFVLPFLKEKYEKEDINKVKAEYEGRIKTLEAEKEHIIVNIFADKPKIIAKEVIMGDVIKSKGQKGDITIIKEQATVGVVKYINQEAADLVEKIAEAIQSSPREATYKEDAQEQLKKIEQELQKVEPNKGRLQRCWDYIAGVIPEVAKVVPWKELIEKVL